MLIDLHKLVGSKFKFCPVRWSMKVYISPYVGVNLIYSNKLSLWDFRVPTEFKSPKYATIIANSIVEFSVNMHEQIRLYTYHSLNKYSLSWLHYMHLDPLNHVRIFLAYWIHITRFQIICFRHLISIDKKKKCKYGDWIDEKIDSRVVNTWFN